MRRILCAVMGLALVWLAAATAQTHKSAPAKKSAKAPVKTTAKKSTPAKRSTPVKKTTTVRKSTAPARKSTATTKKRSSSRTASSRRRASRRPAVTWRNRQTVPSPDRYKEIQNALVARGYLSAGDATGVWGPNSIDALKRFQTAQNIDATGKINSLSLIALGLGPSHANAAAVPPEPPKEQPDGGAGR